MRKGQYAYASGVVIDRCARCGGIWLDRGELAKIRAYVNRETPAEKVLLARAEAESLRRKFEAQERRDGARRGLSPDGAGGRPSALEGVVGFIWDLIWRTGR
jgi:Zn-finger nucleic acid-binding protein